MTDHPIVAAYLRAVEDADLDAMLALFTPDAVVHSVGSPGTELEFAL